MTVPRIVVAGAGIAGLVTAFTLRERARARGLQIDLTVLDAGAEPGGHARSIVEDGFIVERGPNGFLDRAVDTMALIDELQLRDRLVEASQTSKRRYILQGGALKQVPESPPSLLTCDAIGWRGKLRMLREPWAAAPPADTDETVFDFAERRLGREAAETFVDTAVAGISAGDSRMLSVRSQFPMLKEWENEHGSLLKAMIARQKKGMPRARLLNFDRGMGTLTSTLASQLDGAMRAGTPIDRVERSATGWLVHAGGSPIAADRIVFAMPAHAAARVVSGFDQELSTAMTAIPYADLSVAALAYRQDAVTRPLDGYGYLVTRNEDLATLGVLWESSIFPNRAPQGWLLLRIMLGGARRPDVAALDDRSVADLAASEAARVLGISGQPARQWVCRWPSAIAQYTVGHDGRLGAIKRLIDGHRGLHICGTAYDGVSFNDAIASARKTADAIIRELVQELAA